MSELVFIPRNSVAGLTGRIVNIKQHEDSHELPGGGMQEGSREGGIKEQP